MPFRAGVTAEVHSHFAQPPRTFRPPTKNPKTAFTPVHINRKPATTSPTTGATAVAYSHRTQPATVFSPPTKYPKIAFAPDQSRPSPATMKPMTWEIAFVHSQENTAPRSLTAR